ncbi:ATP-dependent DNA ligase LigD phosphoesterase module/ATP-dependent [Sesbania bispinosa]|nr:ATP-dependent DNA ligase LigD phosphoesterase module/ATP-dependent [Sesbania bispinosa]
MGYVADTTYAGGKDARGHALGGDYIPEEGPYGVVDEEIADLGDPGVQFHQEDFEDDMDRIIRGDCLIPMCGFYVFMI